MSEREVIQKAFADFCNTVSKLRDPKTGCPWDLQQTHETLRSFMIEEAYEASEAMGSGNSSEIADELGDVLLQVVLNSQLAQDSGSFTILDVINNINSKMIRRHPHVFGSEAEKAQREVSSIKNNWQAIKNAEKGVDDSVAGVFHSARDKHPATTQALKIGKIASRNNFDWDHVDEVFEKLLEEVAELKEEFVKKERDHDHLTEEIGDVYFTLAQLCRHLKVDPEVVSTDANLKFLKRFDVVEKLAKKDGIDVASAPREKLEAYWMQAKKPVNEL